MSWLGEPLVDVYKGLHLKYLLLNQAYVITNISSEYTYLYSTLDDCFDCLYEPLYHLSPNEEKSWEVDTSIQYKWRVRNRYDSHVYQNDNSNLLCELKPNFSGDFGVYRLDVGKCAITTELPPTNPYPSLLLFFLVLLASLTLYSLMKYILKRKKRKPECEEKLIIEETNDPKLQSLTTLRGLLIVLMVFIMSGGGKYPIFKQVWGGLSILECLFFMYLWTIGVKIPSVVNKALQNKKSKCVIIRDIFFRAAALIFSGVVIAWSNKRSDRSDLITLVQPLQRIGLSYLVAASAYMLTIRKHDIKSERIICKAMGNLVSLLWCWILSGFLLVIFIILISTLYSFNCQSNVSISDHHSNYYHLVGETTNNCNNYMTRTLNLYFVAKSKNIVWVNSFYGFSTGLLGYFSSIICAMIGLKSGTVYVHHNSHSDRIKLWTVWVTLFGVGGVIFAVASLPFNFNLWPISTILLISTSASLFFILTYVLTEVYNITTVTVTAPGVTSLVIIAGNILFKDFPPFNLQENFHNHFYYLLQSLWNVIIWIVTGMILMRNRIRFSV